jgi:hypothetical protein
MEAHYKLLLEAVILVLALACFVADTLGYPAIGNNSGRVYFTLRPLGLALWTLTWLIHLL